MKNRILGLALLLMVGFSNSFAKSFEGVSQKIMQSFQKEFTNAKDVKWETSKDFSKATFKLNDQVMFAYYAENGELLGVSRNIISSQLPINLLNELKKNYTQYWITDLFEMASSNETSYYVTLENSEAVTVLKSSGANGWEIYRKDKKVSE
jgi:hypothetical protein